MDHYQHELMRIKTLLKENPRGLSVSEIARAIRINRNSVAKYLDVLLISGQVDLKSVGSAKIYYLSHRVPISALLDFSSDLIVVLNHDLKIVQINDNFLTFLSVKRDDLLGKSIQNMKLQSLTNPTFRKTMQEALNGKDATIELVVPRGNGEVYFRVKLLPTTFDDGNTGVTIILENITEQKNAEKELRHVIHELEVHQTELEMQNEELHRAHLELQRSQDMYSELYNFAPIGYFTLDATGVIQEANLTGATLLGIERSALLNTKFTRFISRKDQDRFYLHLNQVFATNVRQRCELTLVKPDGTAFLARLESIVAFDQAKELNQWRTIILDITERKQVDDALSLEVDINRVMAELAQALIQMKPVEEITSYVLEAAKRLTDSKFGFVGYIDPKTGYFISPTLTTEIWDVCQVSGKEFVFKEFNGLWGWVLTHRQAVLTNDPGADLRSSGTPRGHIPIQKFLGVPAVVDNTLIGQVAVANADRNYTERDLLVIERLVTLFAIAIQRKRMEESLQDQIHAMGKRVREVNMRDRLSQLSEQHEAIEDIMQNIVAIIPGAWQYPEAINARICVDGQTFQSINFQETRWNLSCGIRVHNEQWGTVEVYYREKIQNLDDLPFLEEDRILLAWVAEQIGRIIEQKQAE